jgi:hypothetical protein
MRMFPNMDAMRASKLDNPRESRGVDGLQAVALGLAQ